MVRSPKARGGKMEIATLARRAAGRPRPGPQHHSCRQTFLYRGKMRQWICGGGAGDFHEACRQENRRHWFLPGNDEARQNRLPKPGSLLDRGIQETNRHPALDSINFSRHRRGQSHRPGWIGLRGQRADPPRICPKPQNSRAPCLRLDRGCTSPSTGVAGCRHRWSHDQSPRLVTRTIAQVGLSRGQWLRAMPAARRLDWNGGGALRTFFGRYGPRCEKAQFVDVANRYENNEGHNDEIQDILQKVSVGQDRRLGSLRRLKSRVSFVIKRDRS